MNNLANPNGPINTSIEAKLAQALSHVTQGANYLRMLAPPNHSRAVDVPLKLVREKLLDGYIVNTLPDYRGQRTAQLPGKYQGRTALVVASGPSAGLVDRMKLADLVAAIDPVVWGTNAAHKVLNGLPLSPCNYLTILDEPLYIKYRSEIIALLRKNNATLVTSFLVSEPIDYHQIAIPMTQDKHAKASPHYECGSYFNGESSGIAAIQMAMHAGCTTIYLIGHDLTVHLGKTHGDGTRTQHELKANYPQGEMMVAGYELLAKHAAQLGIKIINLSPISRLTCFPKEDRPLY